jgi:hypothetical protein
VRNPECSYYSDCLTTAARQGHGLDCRGCEDQNDQNGRETAQELFSYVLLIMAVFYPEAYAIYRSITDPVIRQRVRDYLLQIYDDWN